MRARNAESFFFSRTGASGARCFSFLSARFRPHSVICQPAARSFQKVTFDVRTGANIFGMLSAAGGTVTTLYEIWDSVFRNRKWREMLRNGFVYVIVWREF